MISNIKETVLAMRNWLVDIRRDFHMFPELGNQEFRTQEKIKEYLTQMHIPYETYPDSTCVVGLIQGENPGKTVAIRADMDALPIQEANDVPYRSQNEGVMHACGHDAHMTILLGAAKYFAENRNLLNGNVKLLFQPAEESTGGAKRMIQAGCMKNPDVDFAIGLHVSTGYPVGTIAVRYGAMNAASDDIAITIHGKSAHGAHPDMGIDAVAISAQVINALQTVVSRRISANDSAVLTIGTISGGTAANIIADQVKMMATLRTIDHATRENAKEWIAKIVQDISHGMGGSGETVITKGYDLLINDKQVNDVIAMAAKELLGEDQPAVNEETSLGVEDFCYFTQACKGAYYSLGCANPEKGFHAPGHNEKFDIDEDCLPIGVMAHVATTLKLLEMK